MFTTLLMILADPGLPKELPDYSGIYEVRGVEVTEETKKKYVGLLILKKIGDDQYVGQWTAAIGSNTVGIGTLKGKVLTFAWTTGGVSGLTEYTMTAGKKHSGRWFYSKNRNWSEETIQFKIPLFQPEEEKDDKIDISANKNGMPQSLLSEAFERQFQNSRLPKR